MHVRKDELTSGKIETGIVFEQMLGPEDARSYLRAQSVPDAIIERVLSGVFRRPGSAKAEEGSSTSSKARAERLGKNFYASSGRRRDVVHSCIVEAALVLRTQLSDERIARLLRREQLSEAVVERVLRGEAGTLRIRPASVPSADQVNPPPMAPRPE